MNDIPPINSAGQMSNLISPRPTAIRQPASGETPVDQLEISETGQLLSNLSPRSAIRADRVAEIRQAIADGTYETREKIELTVDRLLDVLRGANVGA